MPEILQSPFPSSCCAVVVVGVVVVVVVVVASVSVQRTAVAVIVAMMNGAEGCPRREVHLQNPMESRKKNPVQPSTTRDRRVKLGKNSVTRTNVGWKSTARTVINSVRTS